MGKGWGRRAWYRRTCNWIDSDSAVEGDVGGRCMGSLPHTGLFPSEAGLKHGPNSLHIYSGVQESYSPGGVCRPQACIVEGKLDSAYH